jgi:hypothetical protein
LASSASGPRHLGKILGQVGFFDQFTVTFSRHALRLAIEDEGVFDQRYGAR